MNKLDVNAVKHASSSAAVWEELATVERGLENLVSEHSDATVQEVAAELAELKQSLAHARGELETAANGRRSAQLERVVDALLPAEVPSAGRRLARAAKRRGAPGARPRMGRLERRRGRRPRRLECRQPLRARVGVADRRARARRRMARHRPSTPPSSSAPTASPGPCIGAVLAHLRRAGLSDWQAALWFTSRTGWLDDRRPVDLLDERPDARRDRRRTLRPAPDVSARPRPRPPLAVELEPLPAGTELVRVHDRRFAPAEFNPAPAPARALPAVRRPASSRPCTPPATTTSRSPNRCSTTSRSAARADSPAPR